MSPLPEAGLLRFKNPQRISCVLGRSISLADEVTQTIFCWAMGLTQHRQAVSAIREIANVALLRGMIGKRGAGLCLVRGHSYVQGDRTDHGSGRRCPRSSSTCSAPSSASRSPVRTAWTAWTPCGHGRRGGCTR